MTDTTSTGPAAAKDRTAKRWSDKFFMSLTDSIRTLFSGRNNPDVEYLDSLFEQAMAQAHAAGRDGGLEAAITLLEVTRMGAVQGSQHPADMIRAAQAGIRALRTATAQPTATEASE